MPSSAAGRSGRAYCREARSTSLIPTGFSRGQASRVGLTSIGIRATATPTHQDAEGMPRGGRVRACRARRVAGNWRSDSHRACSANAFSLRRATTGDLSRAADVVANQQLHARPPSEYERSQFPGVRVAAATRDALGVRGQRSVSTRPSWAFDRSNANAETAAEPIDYSRSNSAQNVASSWCAS